jgi:hypothetical protein
VVTVHFEVDGSPVTMLLDIVEVAKSHSGINLAVVFAKILNDFGISNKVRTLSIFNLCRFSVSPAIMRQIMRQWSMSWLTSLMTFQELQIEPGVSPISSILLPKV